MLYLLSLAHHAMDNWLGSWKRKMPAENQIVFYDRSWYSRALVQPVNGWCSEKQYSNFMKSVLRWEEKKPITFIKMWLSISECEQLARINDREESPLKYWKLSENDKMAVAKYNAMSIKKESMVNNCGDWFSINYNDKSAGTFSVYKKIKQGVRERSFKPIKQGVFE